MTDLRPCDYCEKPIAPNAQRCPHCGGIPKLRSTIAVVAIIVGSLIAAGVAAFLSFMITRDHGRPQVAPPPVQAPMERPAR